MVLLCFIGLKGGESDSSRIFDRRPEVLLRLFEKVLRVLLTLLLSRAFLENLCPRSESSV